MEKITLSRKYLYEKIWSIPTKEICEDYDIDTEGLEEVCKRLNIPIPEKSYFKKLSEGKKVNSTPMPEKSKGTESVMLFKRDDEKQLRAHIHKVNLTLKEIDPNYSTLKDYSFEKFVISTKEAVNKHWEIKNKYSDKSLLLDVHVSPETLCRALLIMDLLIKAVRYKGHQILIEGNKTFVVINDERIQISIGEKSRRVEYDNDYNGVNRDLHPIGVLYIKKEAPSYRSREWKDGPTKGLLEDQIPTLVNDLIETAREQKEENERLQKSWADQEERERIKRDLQARQKKELTMFKELLFEAHRFSLSSIVRDYINHIESQALANNTITDEMKEWISWGRKKADWFDPTLPDQDVLLKNIDIENLRTGHDSSTGFGYSGYGHEQKENKFWKPWYLK
ncbi:MAG TPA: hypothetical protein VFE57_08655 [Cyclobacteriaceae bacterium]|jgi:hypothetical protein|nr:hypothetical protein [Cyclobacteriaceae bacterium]